MILKMFSWNVDGSHMSGQMKYNTLKSQSLPLKKHGNVKHQSAIPSECMFSPGHELIRVLKPEVMAPDGGDFFHKQIGRNKIGITFKSLLFQKYQQKHHLSPIQQSSVKALNRSEETLCVMASCRAHAVDHDLDTPMALL